MIQCCGFETDIVTHVHGSVRYDGRETIVVSTSPGYIIKQIHGFIGVVLVETLVGVVERNVVGNHVRSYRLCKGSTSGRTSTTEFKAIAITPRRTVGIFSSVPHPAVIDYDRVINHIQIPVVVGVIPCTAAMKLGSGPRKQFGSKTIGIASIIRTTERSAVVVVPCITIDHLIIF